MSAPVKPPSKTEMLQCLLRRLRHQRNVQAPRDHLGDRLERHALVGDGMEGTAFDAALERET
ncbi:hypothetical protein ACSTH5_23450, partial [Vibrio parahaemolyticus]